MKLKNIIGFLLLSMAFVTVACDDDVEYTITEVDAPVLVSTTPENGSTNVSSGDVTISITYDKNVFFASSYADQLIFTGGTVTSADVIGTSPTLTVNVNVPERGTQCTLTIPEGLVTGPNQMPAPEVSVTFTTTGLDQNPVYTLTAEAQRVYDFLQENFETRTISATMANVAWNTENAEQVYQWTGQYPAMNCFDYIHLASSPANWIDYGDITPVQQWWDNGGTCRETKVIPTRTITPST